MECHYKVLGVPLNADDDAIKKAYRKAALKYHPDKNPDCLEEATEQFRLVQAAYDVLSDPQERAWYDRHREEILHRKKYENYKDNSIDLWEFFSPSAYRGFGDDDRGFYAVYSDVFKKIDGEDDSFRSDDSEGEEMPSFGDSQSDYDEVVHMFYSSWQAYCTHLSFVWENQYDVKEAPNRRVARMIEKENKKERDKHKKKRNELVRELVSFVRKRDPRVKAHREKLERIAAEQAQKAEQRRASALKERVEEAAKYDEANKEEMMQHHQRVAELEDMMKNEFGFSSSDNEGSEKESDEEDEDYKDELFCVACSKLFKSEMGLRNHQKSKKHKENLNRLREEMKEDTDVSDEQEVVEKLTQNDSIPVPQDGSCNAKLSKKQKKQRRQQQKLLNNAMSADPMTVEDLERNGVESNDILHSSLGENEMILDSLNEYPDTHLQAAGENDIVIQSENTNGADNMKPEPSQTGKRTKQKRQKQQLPQSNPNVEIMGCGKCNQVFNSRNKLFQHLKQTGHSLPLETGKQKRKERRTKK